METLGQGVLITLYSPTMGCSFSQHLHALWGEGQNLPSGAGPQIYYLLRIATDRCKVLPAIEDSSEE